MGIIAAKRIQLRENFENTLDKWFHDFMTDIVNRGLSEGCYFKKYDGDIKNWLLIHTQDAIVIGQPLEPEEHRHAGWFCFEFDKNGTFIDSAPMFYDDLDWAISEISAVLI